MSFEPMKFVMFVAVVGALAGCAGSPCTGELVDGNGECVEGCAGLGVGRVTPSCEVSGLTWCAPPSTRIVATEVYHLYNTETGDLYEMGLYPDEAFIPDHIRAATRAEWDRARECPAP